MATVETEPRTEVRAEARYVRTAPRKAHMVAEQIRGRPVPEARTILAFMTRDAARDVQKVLDSAVANAEANHGLVGDDLYVSAAYVGAGPTLKRWRARARGRVARIKKRTCHITIKLTAADGAALPEPRPAGVETAAAPPAEEASKPRRASRKKSEAAETAEVPEKFDTGEKPKTRRAKAGETPEKPKRQTRASKTDKPDAERKPRRGRKATEEG